MFLYQYLIFAFIPFIEWNLKTGDNIFEKQNNITGSTQNSMDKKQLVTVANFILITCRYKMMSPFRCGIVATESTVRSDNQSTPDLDNIILFRHVGVHEFQAIWIMLHDFQPIQLLSICVRYVKLSTYKREYTINGISSFVRQQRCRNRRLFL